MEKKTVVYKRRPKKQSASDVPAAEPLELSSDNGAANITRSVGSGFSNGGKSVSDSKRNDRKSWVDRSLSNRAGALVLESLLVFNCLVAAIAPGVSTSPLAHPPIITAYPQRTVRLGRRSSLSLGEAFDLSTMASKWIDSVGSRFLPDWATKKKNQGKSGRNGTANRNKRIEPPADFVQEKCAMFAEIDAFELESEEEIPIPWRVKPDIFVDLPKETGLKNRHWKGPLEIVPEAGSEELSSESLSAALSAALRTPGPISAQDPFRAESVCSTSRIESVDSRLSKVLNRQDLNYAEERPASNPVVRTEVVHGWNMDSDGEDGRKIRWQGLDSKRFSAECNQSDPRLTANRSLSERRNSADSISDQGRHSLGSRSEKHFSVELDNLASGFRSLAVGENLRLSTGVLKPLVEHLEDDEIKRSSESEGIDDSEESPRFEELLLETDLLPVFEALMKECHQTRPLSLRDAIAKFCDISSVVKLGEGTFGEAFKASGCVFKIVPMDGEILVNGEVQKTSAEIYSEVLLTNTLTRLRVVKNEASARLPNFCTNFIETKRIYICQGTYEQELIKAWEDWDAVRASDNDHPMIFPEKQVYVVFVLADGGVDLESFVLFNFSEVRSILLQVVLALGVAEEACGFEHRDLHWGNIVLARDCKNEIGYYRLLDTDMKVKTFGVSVSIIDFTLSRIDTGAQVFFCNLSNDPELFEGPTRDAQSDTYRRMLNLTEGHWEGSFPKTNCFWIHYLADTLLNRKSYPISSQEKRALRSFCKRVLLYDSAKTTSSDDFFHDLKVV